MPAAANFYTVPAGTPKAQCRGETCHAVIYWIKSPSTGRMIPVDCDVEGGEEPSERADPRQLDVFGSRPIAQHDGRGVLHFTTCPDAEQFSHGGRR